MMNNIVQGIKSNLSESEIFMPLFCCTGANEAFAELAEDAKDEADNLLEEIKNLGEISKTVLMLFKRLPLEKIKIDNTKK